MSRGGRGIRVVVVDDHQDTRDMTAELLGAHGFEVRAFDAAAEALDAIGRDPVDVVITDIHLGRETGLDLARAIRAREGTRSIAVVAVTGSAESEPGDIGDFDAFCLKPIDVESFPETILRVLRARRG